MKLKAAATFRESRTLLAAAHWSGAASRAYYAVYQALVGEYERNGKRATDFGHVDDPAKWPHKLLIGHARILGLTRTDIELVQRALSIRIRADYHPKPIEQPEVSEVIANLRKLLEGLGVAV